MSIFKLNMCGIFSLLNTRGFSPEFINTQFEKGKNRGPEYSKLESFNHSDFFLGFHRLAINGLNEKSNQPLSINNVVLVCNGEIYNYKYLYELMGIKPETDSDCEVIIHLYTRYGIEQTLQMLDGVFAFVLYDSLVLESIFSRILSKSSLGSRVIPNPSKNSLSELTVFGNSSPINPIF